MKKLITLSTILLIFSLVLLTPGSILAEEGSTEENNNNDNDSDLVIILQEQEKELDPILREDRTHIPIRKLAEAFEAEVEYIHEDRRINIYHGSMEINMWVDARYTIVNNKETETDSPVFIEDDRSYAPLRFLAEWFGYEVSWIAEENIVKLALSEEEKPEDEEETDEKEIDYKEPEFVINLEDEDIFIDMILNSENDEDEDEGDIEDKENYNDNTIVEKQIKEDEIIIYFTGEKYQKTLQTSEMIEDPLLREIKIEPLYDSYQEIQKESQDEFQAEDSEAEGVENSDNNSQEDNNDESGPNDELEEGRIINKLTIDLVYFVPEENIEVIDRLEDKKELNLEIHRIYEKLEEKEVEAGLEYINIRKGQKDGPLNINKLYFDPLESSLVADLVIAEDKIKDLETIEDIADRKEATAAINGGYFHWQGDPLGLTIRDGLLVTRPRNNASAFIMDGDRESAEIKPVRFGDDHRLVVNNTELELDLDSLNRSILNDREAVVYTSEFADKTKDIFEENNAENNNLGEDHLEIVVKQGEVIEVNENITENDTDIPYLGYVIVTGNNHPEYEKFESIEAGDKTWLDWDFEKDFNMLDVSFALGAGPGLVEEGEKYIRVEEENVAENIRRGKNPRTAIGIMPDGELLLMVVDGRNPEKSIGFELDELADYFVDLGAKSAMNLDGGGSSQMWLDGEITNYPSVTDPLREIGNAKVIK